MSRYFALVMIALVMSGCSSGTKFVSVWRNPDFENTSLKNVLVIGVAGKKAQRTMYESTLTRRFEQAGVQAFESGKMISSPDTLTKQAVVKAVQDRGIEAVLVTRVLAVTEEESYVPPTTTVHAYPGWGRPYYGNYWNYYRYGYDVVTTPGYTTRDVKVVLETNLYDAASETLVWSGQSVTFNPSSINDVIEPVTKKLVKQMVDSGVLRRE